MYKTTIVTMFFNIKDLDDSTKEVRPQSFYMKNGRSTLKLKHPMVIFCDNDSIDEIKKIRNEEVDDISLTTYIIKNITDYDFYKENIDIVKENRTKSLAYKGENKRNTPSYFLLTMFKITALLIVKQKNYYNTDYFAWFDFGGSHIIKDFDKYIPIILNNPNPKISFCYIHYRGKEELKSMKKYLEYYGPCGIAAGIITIQKDYVNKFYNGIFSIFHEMLLNLVGHSEESVITYFYDRYPDLCTIYYGDYYSLASNYHEPLEDYKSIKKYFINESIKKGRKDLAIECSNKILKLVNDKKINLNEDEQNFLKNIIN